MQVLFINTILQILWPHLSPAIHKEVLKQAKAPLDDVIKQVCGGGGGGGLGAGRRAGGQTSPPSTHSTHTLSHLPIHTHTQTHTHTHARPHAQTPAHTRLRPRCCLTFASTPWTWVRAPPASTRSKPFRQTRMRSSSRRVCGRVGGWVGEWARVAERARARGWGEGPPNHRAPPAHPPPPPPPPPTHTHACPRLHSSGAVTCMCA